MKHVSSSAQSRIAILVAASVTAGVLVFYVIRTEFHSPGFEYDYLLVPLLVATWAMSLRSVLLTRMRKGSETKLKASSPEIKGNALRTYLYIVKKAPCEFRDIQHALGFSTASLASYHLSKLVEEGYIKQDDHGKYSTSKDLSLDLLEGYTKIGRSLIPQLVFLAILFSILVGYFSFQVLSDPEDISYLIASSVSAVLVLWVEAFRIWRKLSI